MIKMFDSYMRQWLINIALIRWRVKPVSVSVSVSVSVGTVTTDAVTSLGGRKYCVHS